MAFRIDEKQARWEHAVKLANEVLDESRVQLMLKFRFLDMALWRMQPEPSSIKGRYAMATDGKKVFFEPYSVLNRFEDSFNDMIRDYLSRGAPGKSGLHASGEGERVTAPEPWDGNLLQCVNVKSEREVTQPCPTLSNPMDCSLPGSAVHGVFQARVLEWGAIAFS